MKAPSPTPDGVTGARPLCHRSLGSGFTSGHGATCPGAPCQLQAPGGAPFTSSGALGPPGWGSERLRGSGAGQSPSSGARAGQAPHLSPAAAGVPLEARQLLPRSRSNSRITVVMPPSCLAWRCGVSGLQAGEPPGSCPPQPQGPDSLGLPPDQLPWFPWRQGARHPHAHGSSPGTQVLAHFGRSHLTLGRWLDSGLGDPTAWSHHAVSARREMS